VVKLSMGAIIRVITRLMMLPLVVIRLQTSGKAIYGRGTHNPLNAAVFSGHTGIVKALLKHGYSPNERDSKGDYPLNVAVASGHEDIVKALLTSGKAVYGRGVYNQGDYPLSVAVASGYYGIVKLLLKSRYSPNERDNMGIYPLYCAQTSGYKDIVEALLKYGASHGASTTCKTISHGLKNETHLEISKNQNQVSQKKKKKRFGENSHFTCMSTIGCGNSKVLKLNLIPSKIKSILRS
jgi:ankyrin repeat protein